MSHCGLEVDDWFGRQAWNRGGANVLDAADEPWREKCLQGVAQALSSRFPVWVCVDDLYGFGGPVWPG